jgi:hypothetical protein
MSCYSHVFLQQFPKCIIFLNQNTAPHSKHDISSHLTTCILAALYKKLCFLFHLEGDNDIDIDNHGSGNGKISSWSNKYPPPQQEYSNPSLPLIIHSYSKFSNKKRFLFILNVAKKTKQIFVWFFYFVNHLSSLLVYVEKRS